MDTLTPRTRTLAAAGLVAGAATLTVADLLRRLVEPADPTAVTLADAAGRHSTAWLTAGLLSAATTFLLLPGLGVLVAPLRGRGARTARVGAGLLAVGSVASCVHAAGYFGMYDALARSGVSPAAVRAVDSGSESSPFFVPFIVLFMLGMMLGPIVLAAGLRRARLVPVWAPLAAVVFAVAGGTAGVPAGVVGLVAFVALAVAAARVVSGGIRSPRPVPEAGIGAGVGAARS
jgi:hypothetical protein